MPDLQTSRRGSRQEEDVLEARERVRRHVDEVREALDRELKWIPRGKGWTLPLVGLAVGLALALGRTRSR